MSAEIPQKVPTETDLLIEQITNLFGESEDLAKIEISLLCTLRDQVFTYNVYYDILFQMDRSKTPRVQSALGILHVRIQEFTSHLESLGIESNRYRTAKAILDLFSQHSDL